VLDHLTTAASAALSALFGIAKLNELDPESYLRHVLVRVPDDVIKDRRVAASADMPQLKIATYSFCQRAVAGRLGPSSVRKECSPQAAYYAPARRQLLKKIYGPVTAR